MKRVLAMAAVALLAAGCATGIEDPQPAPPPPTKEHAPPAQTFAATGIDDSTPDPVKIGNGGLDAPKPDLQLIRPIPVNGGSDRIGPADEAIATDLEADLKSP